MPSHLSAYTSRSVRKASFVILVSLNFLPFLCSVSIGGASAPASGSSF
jgi:hypothetical protein